MEDRRASREPVAPPELPAFLRSQWREHPGSTSRTASAASRPEQVAEQLAALAAAAEPGTRLGTKEQLREHCRVSVGTFNEALRLAQTRSVITVRVGRVGGIFASRQSALARLGSSVLALDAQAESVADAIRIRNALDPLLVEDAVRHASSGQIVAARDAVGQMRAAAADGDGLAFTRANWALHARIADASPSAMLRSIYLSLLDMIEAHVLSVRASDDHPLAEHLEDRLQLHADLVDAISARDLHRARDLIARHDTGVPAPYGALEDALVVEANR